jgi:DNA-binding transcriptional MerR regulator
MAEEMIYTIGELAEATGVTPRTIRYYTAEGLLPPPDTRGRYALYGEDQLLRLQLIARLKEAYLPLGEMKARLAQLTSEQVGQLLAEHSQPPLPAASAADYLAQVLAQQSTSAAPRTLAETSPRYGIAPAPAASQGPSFMAEGTGGPASPQPPEGAFGRRSASGLPGAEAPPAPAPTPVPKYGYAAPSTQQPGGLLRKLIPERRGATAGPGGAAQAGSATPEATESWRRVRLAQGVELHIREPAEPALSERVEQLIALAQAIFKEE